MVHNSITLNSPVEIIETSKISPLISKVQIKVCYVGEEPNRNGSVITKAVARDMGETLRGCPIVGFYNETKEDFEAHNQIIDISNGEWKIKDTTQAYGFVDLNAKVWFQKFLDDGVEHEYLMTEGYLWTDQWPEAKRVLTKGNNQSMELDENSLNGFWSEDDNYGPSFFIINEAVISKLCILGEDVEPCFEGSQITKVQFSFDESFQNRLFNMMEQIKQFNEEGGANSVDEVLQTEDVVEEEVQNEEVEITPEEEPVEELQEEKNEEIQDEPIQYNLNEIQEYIELQNKYENLQTQFDAMKAEYEELVNFKKVAERKDKQVMIDRFYMLTDEDKKDVIENIDKYSIDDIEAKLSVICVRNKVSFDLDEEDVDKNVTIFSLDDDEVEDDSTPAWIKAVLETKKEKE